MTAALDIATLSSAYGEGFPNVLGEAMACGVPCVVTNTGDSGLIVGNTGRVVPPRDPHALATAWQELIELDNHQRYHLGQQARQRVQDHYSLHATIDQYESLYKELVRAQYSQKA
jgi:glycosyltransferase involved in cell wall biosynthesis